jgi:hypothetical protein
MKYADLRADNAILRQALQTVRDHYRVHAGAGFSCCGTCDQIAMDGLYASADLGDLQQMLRVRDEVAKAIIAGDQKLIDRLSAALTKIANLGHMHVWEAREIAQAALAKPDCRAGATNEEEST